MKILVTGFKPFLGQDLNPSEMLAKDLSSLFPEVDSLVLPTEFGRSFEILKNHLRSHTYDYVISIGQAMGRNRICFEKIGLNWTEGKNQDEAGVKPAVGPISNSPLALMTTFPVNEAVEFLKAHPVVVSFSAGTYVCNDLYFRTLECFPKMKAVFVHVPILPEQNKTDGAPDLDYKVTLSALTDLIKFLKN